MIRNNLDTEIERMIKYSKSIVRNLHVDSNVTPLYKYEIIFSY